MPYGNLDQLYGNQVFWFDLKSEVVENLRSQKMDAFWKPREIWVDHDRRSHPVKKMGDPECKNNHGSRNNEK